MPDAPIYLDNHATTRVDPRVVEAMLPYFSEIYGNAASTSHSFGWEAKEAVDAAARSIAAAIGASAREIVFTSGATESNNLAIRGVAERQNRRGNHLITVQTEHRAVLDPIERLGRRGFEVDATWRRAGRQRQGRAASIWTCCAAALRDDTLLVSVMLANNEIGVIQPLAEIAAICRERGVLVHCDATQAVGKMPVDVTALGRRSDELFGPQDLRPQGRRRPVRPPQHAAGAAGAANRRRRPRRRACAAARSTCRASSASPGRWSCAWRKCRASRRGWRRCAIGCSRADFELDGVTLNGPELGQGSGLGIGWQRTADITRPLTSPQPPAPASLAPAAGNLNVSFAYVDGEALLMNMKERGGQLGQCLHVGQSRAQPRAAGLGAERRSHAQQPAIWAGTVQHGRTISKLRSRP